MMRKMTLLALAAAVLLLAPAAVFAQFEGVLTYTMKGDANGKPLQADWQMWIANTGWRSEMTMDMTQMKGQMSKEQAAMTPGTMKVTMLGKVADKGVSYLVNDSKKVYSVVRPDAVPDKDTETWKAERLGKDTIAGLSCDKVLMTDSDGDRVEGCFTSAIVGSRDWLEAMRAQGKQNRWMDSLKKAGVEGFPIRMGFIAKGETKPQMVMELVKATKRPVSASMFSVPAGYKEVGMLGVMTSPEQEQAVSEQMKAMQSELDKLPPEQRKQIEEMMKKYGAPTPPPNKN